MARRPEDIPEGYGVEWVVDEAFELCLGPRKCAMRGCRELALACLLRESKGRRGHKWTRRWGCCADHMYGREIRDGKVMSERLIELETRSL